MTASDLRIGNLVLNRKGNPIKINIQYIELYQSWEFTNYTNEKPFIAIALSEDRLIDFGFVKDVFGWYNKGMFSISIKEERIVLVKDRDTSNEYYIELPFYNKLHELQNLYRWTVGKELTEKQKP